MSTRPGRTGIDPASVLFGSTRRRVLAWLLGHADEAYYLRQIARHTGVSAGTVQRELEQLTAAGLLRRTVDGRQVYFQAERDAPIFPELQALFAKTVGIVDVLREALAPLTRRIRVAFVFGSGARGELRAGSDVDVMVVGDVEFRDVVGALAAPQARLGRDLNPTVYPTSEFAAKLGAGHHFLTGVLGAPRLYVVGDDNELARLGAKRLADEASGQRQRDSRPAQGRRARPRGQRH